MRIRQKTAITAIGLSLCFLAACLPVTSMPPPLPGVSSNSGATEAGAALVGGNHGWTRSYPYAGLETWWIWDKKRDFGLLAGISTSGGLPYIGGMVRSPIKESDETYLGIQTSVNFVGGGASIGVPISFALSDRVWLYSGPTLAIDVWEMPSGFFGKIPIGLVVETKSSLRILQEVGIQSRSPNFPTVYYSIGLSKSRSKQDG
jgi:hypothetical protein